MSYPEFVAPALLASSAMNGAVYESTMNIFFKLKWAKTYDAVLATPLGPGDVAVGEITWSLLRGAIYAVCFLIVMVAMGLMPSMWGVLAVPAALLIGLAFAATGMAATTYMKSWQDFDLVALVTLPLFLFSATFYPISVYPGLAAGRRPLLAAVPRHRADPWADARAARLGHAGPCRRPGDDGAGGRRHHRHAGSRRSC